MQSTTTPVLLLLLLPLSPLTPPSGRYLSVIPGMLEITIASLRDTRPLGGVDPAVLHIPAIVGVEVEVEKGKERERETKEGGDGGGAGRPGGETLRFFFKKAGSRGRVTF